MNQRKPHPQSPRVDAARSNATDPVVERFRVAMVVRLFDPWIGGMERQALKLARRMVERGSRVEILTGRWYRGTPRNDVSTGVPITRHHTAWNGSGVRGVRRLGSVAYMLTLAWHLWMRRKDLDVIHVHGLSYHAYVSTLVGKKLGIPVIIKLANSGQASDITKMREGKHLPLTRFMLPMALRAERLVALNDLVVSELESAGVAPDRIVRIPNGVELDDETRSYRPGTATSVLYVGRLHRQKAVDDLLRAVAGLVQNPIGEGLELTIVGDGPERRSLEMLAAQLGLGHRVHFEGEIDNVTPYLYRADLLVLPSRAEGLSNTLLEAMSTGLPVVASNIAANRELIEHGVNGLLYSVGDTDALQEALAALLGGPSLRKRLGCEGRNTVEYEYSIDKVAERYEMLYADLGRTGDSR